MAETPGSKRERQEARQREGRRRAVRTWTRRGLAAALVILPLLLWQVDRTGAVETIEATVLETRIWRHYQRNGRWHTHQAARLDLLGVASEELDKADDLRRGQRVPIRVRRGRITGSLYFQGRDDVVAEVAEPE